MELIGLTEEEHKGILTRSIFLCLVFSTVNIISGLAFWIYCIPNFSKILETDTKKVTTTLGLLGALFLMIIFLKTLRKVLKIFENLKKRTYLITSILTIIEVFLLGFSFYKIIDFGVLSLNALALIGENTTFLSIAGLTYGLSLVFFLPTFFVAFCEKENI